MVAFKIVSSILVLFGILAKFGLDYWWRDRRTTAHENCRNVVLAVTLLSATCIAAIDLKQAYDTKHAAQEQATKIDRIEHFTLGGLAPDVFVELYAGPNHPTPPRLSLSPEFPGIAAIWIDNKETFPIYDLTTFMTTMTTDGVYTVSSKAFNNPTNRQAATVGSGDRHVVMVPIQAEQTTNGLHLNFDFLTRTRRGSTSQTARFRLINNRWEYARMATDLETTNVILTEHSQNYPCDAKGEPLWK
ncbi:MAG: hypothetical protein ACXWKG_05175 [Limisphaerales bacterium]